MAIQFEVNKYRLQDPEDGGSSGGDGGGQQQSGDGGTTNKEDNKEDNLISHENLWDTAPSNEAKPDANQNQNQQQQQSDPNETFNKHIDSLDFAGNIDLAASMTAIQNGDTEAFGKLIQQIGANAYRNSLVDANKVVQQRVDKMAESVKSDVSSSNATSELVKEMNVALPFTKNPAFAPVAQLTLTQFLSKGVAPGKAIEEVGKYFNNLSGEVSKMNPSPPGSRPAGNFGANMNSNNAGNTSEDEPDWIALLGGPAVS